MGACEPGQVRKEAALSGYFHVPWGCSGLRPYREVMALSFAQRFFLAAKRRLYYNISIRAMVKAALSR